MKRVGVYLSSSPAWGGVFQYTLSILQELNHLHREKKIHLIAIYEDELWEKVFKENGINNSLRSTASRIQRSALYRIWRTLRLPISLWRKVSPILHPTVRLILKANCDVCFFPGQEQVSYFGPYKAITSIHDLMHIYEDFPEVKNAQEQHFREFNYQNICRFSSLVLSDSELGKVQISENYGHHLTSKIKVLKYVIPQYLELKTQDDSVIERFAIPTNYFFYPAQFWSHKNHLRLIQAFALLVKEYPSLSLVLAGGKKNGYQEAVDLVGSLGLKDSVIFTGYVNEEEIISLYKNARALVMPTFFGPTNIPPLEALSFGTPVVYSKIYAYEEFLSGNAIFVDPKSVTEIAGGMRDVLEGKHPKISYDTEVERKTFKAKLLDIIETVTGHESSMKPPVRTR